jgi:hypothetical protein
MSDQYHAGMISRLRAAGNDVAWLIESFPPDTLEQPADGDWSARNVLEHLRDVEYGIYIHRLQATALEEEPEFERFDAAGWRAEHRPGRQTAGELLTDFLAGRRAMVGVLQRLHPEDWDRQAKSAAPGLYNVEVIAERAYSHTLEHLIQLLKMRHSVARPTSG